MRKILLALLCLLTLSACGKPQSAAAPSGSTGTGTGVVKNEPRLDRIKNICRLSTLKCYYHNIAKATKSPGTGAAHFGEKERTFWIEYTGTAEISYDAEKITMRRDGSNITITLPEPDIVCTVDMNSWTHDSYVISEDNLLNPNPITANDQTEAVRQAQDDMLERTRQNTALINTAEAQAKELMENYVHQIGELTGTEYTVTWEAAGEAQTSAPER